MKTNDKKVWSNMFSHIVKNRPMTKEQFDEMIKENGVKVIDEVHCKTVNNIAKGEKK
jgi:hypothetical protein